MSALPPQTHSYSAYSPQDGTVQYDLNAGGRVVLPVQPSALLPIGSMVAGILGVALVPSLGVYLIGGPLGLVLGPTAITLGMFGRRRARQGLAKDGSLAVIGTILGAVTVVLAVVALAATWWLYSGDWD